MLTGERLFKGEDVTEILASVVKDQPDLTRVPLEVRRLVERCLEKDPKKRLRDIGDAWALLENKSTSPPNAPLPRQRQWLSWGAAALFFVTTAGVSGMHFLKRPVEPEVTRFQVLPPEKTSFGNNFSISPDGRKLAFAAQAPDGRPVLWVRSFDAIESHLLAGTEGYDGGQPFWSPESRYLAFGADGKLKKIDISGGPAQALCDVGTLVLGGGWSREGSIIFGGAANGSPIWHVPATGGTAIPLTVVDPVKEARHTLPSLLPDGRHFIYTRLGFNPAQSGIYVGSVDAKPDQQSSKRLLASQFGAQYTSTPDSSEGRFLFLRDGTLMAQSFDASRLELSGEAVPIAERVGAYLNFGQFGVSSKGVLVYRVGGGGRSFHLTWYDRQGKPLGTAGPPGTYQMLALSPDRNQVATMRTDAQTSFSDIWLIDLARNIPTRLTFDPTTDIDPIWSHDGLHVVFQSSGAGLKRKLSSGGGTEEVLLAAKEQLHPDDVSPDGRFLLYAVLDPKTKSDLWVLPMEGDRKPIPYLKTPYDEGQGQFSLDGRWVAYRSEESGKSEIYVQPFPATAGGGGKWLVSSGGGAQPRWGRDGKELFYISNERTVMAVDVTTSPSFKVGVPKPLFDAPFRAGAVNVFRWDVSADGKKFLIITTGQETEASPITVVLNWTVSLKR